jgi:hypothetical protein
VPDEQRKAHAKWLNRHSFDCGGTDSTPNRDVRIGQLARKMESGFFEEHKLPGAVRDFEGVVESSERLCKSGERLAHLMSVFFGMRAAFSIRASLGLTWISHRRDADLPEAATDGARWGCDYLEQASLPGLAAVRSATQKLVAAVGSDNGAATVSALEGMGVFALCPIPDEQLSRMERLAGFVSGRARLIFLVELSLFAVELGDFDAASKYVTQAWAFDPSAWELYNLCVLEGLFALNAGKTRAAVECLEKSIDACQVDEHASLNCAVRAPNFLLAQRLFEQGERIAVLRHLLDCKNVWQLSLMSMDKWIHLIESGKTPDFQGCEAVKGMNQPSYKLGMQWMRARSLEEAKAPSLGRRKSKSPAEVVAARKRLLEDCQRQMSAIVKKGIEYLDN